MYVKTMLFLILPAALLACAPPVDPRFLSTTDAPQARIAVAKAALEVCMKTSDPASWDLRHGIFRSAGFDYATAPWRQFES